MTASPNSGFAIRADGRSLRGSHSTRTSVLMISLALQTPFRLSVNFARDLGLLQNISTTWLAIDWIIATSNVKKSRNFLKILHSFHFLGLLRRWLLASFDWQISLLALKVSSFFRSVLLFVFFGELLNFTSTGGDFLPPSFQSSALHLDMIMHSDWQDRVIFSPNQASKEDQTNSERNVGTLSE